MVVLGRRMALLVGTRGRTYHATLQTRGKSWCANNFNGFGHASCRDCAYPTDEPQLQNRFELPNVSMSKAFLLNHAFNDWNPDSI